jgi:hypothetical protein
MGIFPEREREREIGRERERWKEKNVVIFSHIFKTSCENQHWELTPVILATQEAEIRRFKVRSQPGQIV